MLDTRLWQSGSIRLSIVHTLRTTEHAKSSVRQALVRAFFASGTRGETLSLSTMVYLGAEAWPVSLLVFVHWITITMLACAFVTSSSLCFRSRSL